MRVKEGAMRQGGDNTLEKATHVRRGVCRGGGGRGGGGAHDGGTRCGRDATP